MLRVEGDDREHSIARLLVLVAGRHAGCWESQVARSDLTSVGYLNTGAAWLLQRLPEPVA